MSIGKYAERPSAEIGRLDAEAPRASFANSVLEFSHGLRFVDPDKSCEATLDFVRGLGLRSLTITAYPTAAAARERADMFTNLPHQLFDWKPIGGWRMTPVFRSVLSLKRPFTTKFAFESYPDEPATLQVIDVFRDLRIGDGIVVPIVDDKRVLGHAAVGAWEYDLGLHESRLLAMAIDTMAEHMMHSNAVREVFPDRLTPRQRDVLSWAANGKTNHEIAQILGISTRTVVAHIQQAAEALGTVNKTQTVARALVYGEITP